MNRRKVEKYIEYFSTKIKIIFKEKTYKEEGQRLKYILEKAESDDLIIIFSGIPRKGIKARYNYNRTLKDITTNKLFILDDFGYDHRGAYYLGKDNNFFVERLTKNLISLVKQELGISKTYYVGSSKGGWAAVYFGIQEPGSTIVAGSLHYRLGNYLTSTQTFKDNQMAYVMGHDYTSDDVSYLNSLLEGVIDRTKDNNPTIYYHYSDVEKIYETHTVDFLEKVNTMNWRLITDIEHYEKHAEISYYFPAFLKETLNNLVGE